MKNSAWYHKLWLNKLNDLPLKEDANSSWKSMEQMLDQQLPAGNSSAGTHSPKPKGSTLGSYLGYIVGAAAVVGVTVYLTLSTPEQAKKNEVVKDTSDHVIQIAADTLSVDSLFADTDISDGISVDTLAGKLAAAADISSSTHIKIDQIVTIAPAVPISASVEPVAVIAAGSVPDKLNQAKTNNTIAAKENDQTSTRQLPSDLTANTESLQPDQNPRKNSAKTPIITPPYNFGLEAGVNHANDENTFYIGAFGTYALSPRWMITTGLRTNTPRSFTGQYTRQSYFRPDSMPVFSFTDQRKVLVLDVPLIVTYKLSNTISIDAGPIISLPLKQTGIKLGPIHQPTDTLRHTNVVYDILKNTKMNSINFGFSTGISLHLAQFDINARYQQLSPYRFSNEFGNNKFEYRSFQIGIGFKFKE